MLHRLVVVTIVAVALSGCSALSSNGIKKQVRTFAASVQERAAPDGEFAERLNRVCTSTATCTLSTVQQQHCASLKASIATDYDAATLLLNEVK